jgi:branched-chain amino acid transport system permease protein
MLYREAGQFKTTYSADQALFPIAQDRVGIMLILVGAFILVPS